MHNNVVVGVRNHLVKGGFHCLTFNFRGVGESTGQMEDGVAEQEDLVSVVNYACDTLQYSRIALIGYSYGGLIGLSAAARLKNLETVVLISYPVGFVSHLHPDFTLKIPLLFIHGEHDDLIPLSRIRELIPKFQVVSRLETIATDHFYNGKEKQVGKIIQNFLLMRE